MSNMGSHDSFEYLKHKLWPKEGLRIKVLIWLLPIKSQESPRNTCVQVTCHISLERFQQRLQFCFRPHFNQRSVKKLWPSKMPRNPIWKISGFLKIPRTKWHLDVAPVVNMKRCWFGYKGEGGCFLQVQVVINIVNPCMLMVHPCTKNVLSSH
jgi:hypothetical protein